MTLRQVVTTSRRWVDSDLMVLHLAWLMVKVHDMHDPYGAAIDINWTDNPAFIKHPHDLVLM